MTMDCKNFFRPFCTVMGYPKTKFEIAVVEKVRLIRMEKGLSQEYVAGVLGLTAGFIGQIESPNNPSKYNLNHLNKLAYEFGCSVKDFIPEKPVVEDYWKDE